MPFVSIKNRYERIVIKDISFLAEAGCSLSGIDETCKTYSTIFKRVRGHKMDISKVKCTSRAQVQPSAELIQQRDAIKIRIFTQKI